MEVTEEETDKLMTENLQLEGEEGEEEEAEAKFNPEISKIEKNNNDSEIISKINLEDEPNEVVTLKSLRVNSRNKTMGLSTSPKDISYDKMKARTRERQIKIAKILKIYRDIDNKEYNTFIKLKVFSKDVKKIFHEYYLLSQGFAECSLIYILNSYTETGIVRLFQSFYLEFDSNNDFKMQKEELENCIEFLAKEEFIGKNKMMESLNFVGVDCKNTLSFFQEGAAVKKILNKESLNQLFKIFKMKNMSDSQIQDSEAQYINFYKFSPLVIVFFLEYLIKIFLKKKIIYQFHLGFPYEIEKDGSQKFNINGEPSGLFRSFVIQLKGEKDIKKPMLTYRIVSRALLDYRSSGLSDIITMESVERIMKKVRGLMRVDPVSGIEDRHYTMSEILPELAARICTETTWTAAEFRKSIEKYDHFVNWYGGAHCMKLEKNKLNEEVKKAFSYCPNPTFEQFVKGFNFILKKSVQTLDSAAAYFVAKKLLKTPDTCFNAHSETNHTNSVHFDLRFILEEDNLHQRLYNYSMKSQFKLILVRLLHSNHFNDYKKQKKIHKKLEKYNQIISDNNLFVNVPGEFGKFEDVTIKLVKIDHDTEALKEDEIRKELKKKKFLETILERDSSRPKIDNKVQNAKRNSVVKLKTMRSMTNVSEKRKEKIKIMELRANANDIDRVISQKDQEKEKIIRMTRESNAFPNSSDITPEMIFHLLEYSNCNQKELKDLKDYIYSNKDKITYQDTFKFLTEKTISSKKKDEKIIKAETKYTLRNNEYEVGEITEKEEIAFKKLMGDSYDRNIINQMTLRPLLSEPKFTFSIPRYERKEPIIHKDEEKDRGCGCLIF
jgi:hypothetical protein